MGVGVGRLPSSEISNFSRYIVESLHKAWGLLDKISLSLRRFFCWKRECSLPYKLFISLQVLVLFHHCDVLIVETGLYITHILGI